MQCNLIRHLYSGNMHDEEMSTPTDTPRCSYMATEEEPSTCPTCRGWIYFGGGIFSIATCIPCAADAVDRVIARREGAAP